MKEKKNVLIIALLVAIIAMAVGYAALGETLTITGTGNINVEWDVQIESITAGTLTGATVTSAEKTGNTTASFDVDLAYPGASATFEVVAKNYGTINAAFDGFSDLTAKNAEAPDYITYTVTGITEGDVLSANEANTQTATITVTWDGEQTEVPEGEVSKTATITLDYVQAP